ncbi:hypothetical protein ABZ924_30255 [Streptomyces sp. NPDC046876]|uniref:hypothetical protein n=1 Tax=Streptomyces sp. NPDC046876 TaxID=3155616 RepID=UPI0033C02DDE
MSARTAAATRRPLRTAAATAVVAAVAGTVLMPLSAYAAPAAENLHALKVTLGAPAPSGPLTRGGATETFELKVTNPTDKVHSFHPWINGDWGSSTRLQANDMIFKVAPADGTGTPATDSAIQQQDGDWQGVFTPAGKDTTVGFEVPAGGTFTWKVTVGLAKSYPTNLGDFTLRASSFKGELAADGAASLTFKTDPTVKPGNLETWFDKVNPCQGVDERQCREMDLRYRATGDGVFNTALATSLKASLEGGAGDPDLQLQVQEAGVWKDLKLNAEGKFPLADIESGYGKASGERTVHLRAKVGPKATLKKDTTVTLDAFVGLAEGNKIPFVEAKAGFQFGPVTTASPSPSPSASASTSASPSPSASASASTGTGTGTSTGTGTTSGSLATTGADSNTGLYSALAAALVAAGGAFVWLGARRRKAAARG